MNEARGVWKLIIIIAVTFTFFSGSLGAKSIDYIEEIRRLGELKAEGLLTEEEFEAQKSRILEQSGNVDSAPPIENPSVPGNELARLTNTAAPLSEDLMAALNFADQADEWEKADKLVETLINEDKQNARLFAVGSYIKDYLGDYRASQKFQDRALDLAKQTHSGTPFPDNLISWLARQEFLKTIDYDGWTFPIVYGDWIAQSQIPENSLISRAYALDPRNMETLSIFIGVAIRVGKTELAVNKLNEFEDLLLEKSDLTGEVRRDWQNWVAIQRLGLAGFSNSSSQLAELIDHLESQPNSVFAAYWLESLEWLNLRSARPEKDSKRQIKRFEAAYDSMLQRVNHGLNLCQSRIKQGIKVALSKQYLYNFQLAKQHLIRQRGYLEAVVNPPQGFTKKRQAFFKNIKTINDQRMSILAPLVDENRIYAINEAFNIEHETIMYLYENGTQRKNRETFYAGRWDSDNKENFDEALFHLKKMHEIFEDLAPHLSAQNYVKATGLLKFLDATMEEGKASYTKNDEERLSIYTKAAESYAEAVQYYPRDWVVRAAYAGTLEQKGKYLKKVLGDKDEKQEIIDEAEKQYVLAKMLSEEETQMRIMRCTTRCIEVALEHMAISRGGIGSILGMMGVAALGASGVIDPNAANQVLMVQGENILGRIEAEMEAAEQRVITGNPVRVQYSGQSFFQQVLAAMGQSSN